MQARGIITALAASVLAIGAPAEAQSVPDPALFDADGYRAARYRSPIRLDPAPARTMSLAEALALEPGQDAFFIDVMPVESGVRDPASGVWTLSTAHLTIPGALWFPETGRASADPDLWAALEAAIHAARSAAPDLPVVLFCRTDCWMSWNAARRLAHGGFSGVHWFAEGTDGWHSAGRALTAAVPVAAPASVQLQQEK